MDWIYFGNVNTEGRKLSSASDEKTYIFSKDNVPDDFIFETEIMLVKDGEAGVYFKSKAKSGPGWIVGYYFCMNAADNTVSLYEVNQGDGETTLMGKMRYPFKKDVWYKIKIVFSGVYAYAWFNNFLLDKDPYPKYDFVLDSYKSGGVGLFFGEGCAQFRNISVRENDIPKLKKEDTYTNPLVYGADPDILYYDGVYYLYFTDTADMTIFQAYTSTDMVNWSGPYIVFDGKDGWGYRGYMSPNVIYKDRFFYMFYASHDENKKAHISYATSKSPMGPFKSNTKKPLHSDVCEIGGHPFIDDDGRCYLTNVRFNHGNEVWAMEITMENGVVTVLEDTITQLLMATEDWEKDYANIVEGGVIMKHNGLYYMMYAGGHYKGNYGEGYAIAEKPLGPYVKYKYNPILRSNFQSSGVGDSIKAVSPDGKELIMFYHQHYSTRKISPRWIRMDRMKFVKDTDGGPDILVVYGPTVTPQLRP